LAHVADGTPCQDASRVRVLGDHADATLVACVADGAGSAKHSAFGSTIACDSIINGTSAFFDSRGSLADLKLDDVVGWCEDARTKIGEDVLLHGTDMREFATTLCGAIVSADRSHFFQIGDGAIVAKRNGVCGVVFWPQSGEYANTTNFLTSKIYRDHLQLHSAAGGFSDVALITDGIERLALQFDSRVPHSPFFDPLFQVLRTASDSSDLAEDLLKFLQSDSVQSRSDDDKTLILASRVS
jgi:hypothetical protein